MAEDRPCDRFIRYSGPAAILDVVHTWVRASFQPGHGSQDRRPAEAHGVGEVKGVVPAIARLAPGVVGEWIAYTEAVDGHPNEIAMGTGLRTERDLHTPWDLFPGRKAVVKELRHEVLPVVCCGPQIDRSGCIERELGSTECQ
jgi:hypothetical protein